MAQSFLKLLSPPILFKIKNWVLPNKSFPKLWEGDYSCWEEAAQFCTGYNDSLVLEKCKNALLKVKNKEAIYERDSVLFDKIYYSWPLLAGLLRIGLENNNKLNVLDFGGSLGSTYFQNKSFLSSLELLNWSIVEQKNFVDCGKKYFEDDTLKFYYSIEDAIHVAKPNVLVLSGVLQYLPKIDEWLALFNNCDIDYIIIDRTTLIDGSKNIITIQTVPEEIYNASYPCYFFRNNFILDGLNKYDLISDFDGLFDPINYILNEGIIANWKGYILKKR